MHADILGILLVRMCPPDHPTTVVCAYAYCTYTLPVVAVAITFCAHSHSCAKWTITAVRMCCIQLH